MRKIFTTVILLTTVAVINAQDAQNPWHLIAFENEEEVAFYNVEMITGINATAQNVTIALDNGKEFTHPLTTMTFGFDPREAGTGTANENFTSPQWNVYYANGRLYFSESVNGIAVYTVTGALIAWFAESYTEVSVDLLSGIYIVQAGGKSTKLAVGTNGNSGMFARYNVETQAAVHSSTPISLRSSNGIKVYWNITASNSTMSLEIPNVEKFYYTADNSIVFTLNDGNTIELEDYQGIDFTIEPSLSTVHDWDFSKYEFWGGSYGFHGTYSYDDLYGWLVAGIVHKNGIIIYDFKTEEERYYTNDEIDSKVWEKEISGQVLKLSIVETSQTGLIAACSFVSQWGNMVNWKTFNGNLIGVNTPYYAENGGNNFASAVIKITTKGVEIALKSLKDSKDYSHTFTGWNPK